LLNHRPLPFSFKTVAVAVGGVLNLVLFNAYHNDASPVTLSPELQATPSYFRYMDLYTPIELCFSHTPHHPSVQYYKAVIPY
jgi:hypothetical protein